MTADVCVVGGGFAGLWTAYELHERDPGLDVVLLEADIVGAGGSGANGGFFSPSWTGLSSLCKALGEEGGVTYAAALAAMVDELDGWIARHRRPHRRPPRGHPLRSGRGVAARAGRRDVPAAGAARPGRPAAACRRRRRAARRRLAALHRRRDHTGPHGHPAGQARARAPPRAAGARRAHLRGHADGPHRGRPAGARRHARRRRERRPGGPDDRRLGGAGAALPPRLRRLHRLHGRHRADPGADRADRLDLPHGRGRSARDAVLPAHHGRRSYRHRRRRHGHRLRLPYPRPRAHLAAGWPRRPRTA